LKEADAEIAIKGQRNLPLYSIPHFSLTMTGFPVKLFKNGFGLTGTVFFLGGGIRKDVKRVKTTEKFD